MLKLGKSISILMCMALIACSQDDDSYKGTLAYSTEITEIHQKLNYDPLWGTTFNEYMIIKNKRIEAIEDTEVRLSDNSVVELSDKSILIKLQALFEADKTTEYSFIKERDTWGTDYVIGFAKGEELFIHLEIGDSKTPLKTGVLIEGSKINSVSKVREDKMAGEVHDVNFRIGYARDKSMTVNAGFMRSWQKAMPKLFVKSNDLEFTLLVLDTKIIGMGYSDGTKLILTDF